ncbi:MAG TPA: secretin N-terminal domain-containing protein [bacterium]|nr:secretin N-terminal domain-containing protein [bacterium]
MAKHAFSRMGFALGLAILASFAVGRGDAVRPEIDTQGMATIDIDVQNATAPSVLRMFAEFSGVNIIAGPEVDGKVTADLTGVPWLVALDTVLRTNGYGWERMSEDIIRVTTLEKLNNERVNEEVLERKREDFLPLQTQVVKVSYAKADEMKTPLETLLTGRGKIETDERTNALVVTDIADRVNRVREMAEILDYKTPQVEINAKLVDVDKRAQRDLGISWGATGFNEGDAAADFFVDAPIPGPVGTVDFSLIGSDADLAATLQVLERKNMAHIISNPRITTADNKQATILVGKKIPLVIADEAGNAITQLTTIGIKMAVTPHINSDGRITLDLKPEVSDLLSQATVQGGIVIGTSEAETRVIVNDGQTAVIGGLIRTNESVTNSGVPILMDIPLVGYLFKSQNKVTEERELLIFVTPRIIEPEDMG